jgi:hypothetical protein
MGMIRLGRRVVGWGGATLCILWSGLWVRGQYRMDSVSRNTNTGRKVCCWAFGSDRHVVVASRRCWTTIDPTVAYPTNPADSGWTHGAEPATEFHVGRLPTASLERAPNGRDTVSQLQVVVPYWLLVAGSGVAAAAGLTGRRSFGRGHCQRCGYDLRASPGRCPECGAGVETKDPI